MRQIITNQAFRWLTGALGLLAVLLSPSIAEAARDGAVSLQVLVNGRPLEEHPARGTTYIEAVEGREYALRVRNHTGSRVAVALSVDGLNTIDAKRSTAQDASKWVIGPFGTVTIKGWQTGPETARRFFFTSEKHSYGAWLGETDNLGVISAVLFRERPPRRELLGGDQGRRKSQPQAGSAAPRAESDSAEGLRDDVAATGIGRETGHRVRKVHLDLEPQPSGAVTIRYEYRPQLVALGVLPPETDPEPPWRRERASGFEGLTFAPDPYREGRR
jgi:hypothetical protein